MIRKLFIAFIIFLTTSYSQYIIGDQVNNIAFTDSNVDTLMNINYSSQSTKDLISTGKVIVVSFFNPG